MKKVKHSNKKVKFGYGTISLQKRFLLIIVLIALVFVLLFVKLTTIQFIDGDFLTVKAREQWMRDLPLRATRGLIYDRNGAVLVENELVYDVYVRAVNVEDSKTLALFLSGLLGIDYKQTLAKCENRKVGESLIKLAISREDALQIIASGYKGVYLSENARRVYQNDSMLSRVLGYTRVDGVGQTGLEMFYNKLLSGTDGQALMSGDASGKELDAYANSYVPSIPGQNLTLTIDKTIENICENILDQIMEEQKPKSASAIVLNANTCEVLALASTPSFNLNEPPRDNIVLLNELSKNTLITDVYEPGSTFKLLTTAAALEEGKTSLDDRFFDPGFRIVDGEKIKCWKTTGHGSQTLVDAVSNSCNSVFMDLGLRLGVDTLYAYLQSFGIGSKTGIDFAGESAGIMMNKNSVKNVDLARISFGQAVAVTPIQLAVASAAVINGGNVLKPQFLKSVDDYAGTNVYSFNKTIVNKPISEQTSADIRYMMKNAVEHANAIAAYVPGYTLGGKTGTAQKYENGQIARGKYVSSFVGFAPYENPEYLLLLLVDEPGAGAYYGSVVAAPYAKNIFEEVFTYKQMPASNLEEDLKKLELTIKMPDLTGYKVLDALAELKKLGLQVEVQGEGEYVFATYPSANVMLYNNAVVVLDT